jgi:hypothetical protein
MGMWRMVVLWLRWRVGGQATLRFSTGREEVTVATVDGTFAKACDARG